MVAFTTNAQTWVEIAKALPTPQERPLDEQGYGSSVSIDGNYAVIGASEREYKGIAYVLYYNGTDWEKIAQLTASDIANGDRFGGSVSISDDNIVIGAYTDDDNGDGSGSAYVFTKPSGGWEDMTETAKLTASDGAEYNHFGKSVSISSDNIVIGAYQNDGNRERSGSAYVFTKPTGGWSDMTETAKLKASDGDYRDYFGYSVSISGNNIVIGAYQDDDNNSESGSVYVFTKPSGGWSDMTETAKLTASDGVKEDYFGYAVSISGNNIVIGAYQDDDNGDESGSAYVFARPSGGWIDTTETAKLTASDGADINYFGYSVSIDEDNIVIGAYGDENYTGSTYVFSKPSGGWSDMTETAKLTASDGASSDCFGYSVSISSDNIVTGAYYDDDNGDASGSAYVFVKPPGGWVNITQTAKLKSSDGTKEDHFGKSVSIDGDNIVIGACVDDDNGDASGSAYVFTKPSSGWVNMTQTAKLMASDGADSDLFGVSVSINGDYIIIGAYDNDIDAGAAYLFRSCTETNSEISPVVCGSYTSPSGKIWTTTGTYKDTIPNANLCDSVITIDLTVHQINYNIDTNVCYNGSYTYADGTTVENLVANESHIFSFTASTGCDSIITENITILNIDVSTSVAEDLTITANASYLTYQWLDCDNAYSIISGATEQSFTPTANGNYAVKITDGSCSDTSNCVAITTMGIIEPSITNQVNIYPNPTKGIVNINLGELKNVSIKVTDISGKVIYNAENINSKSYQFKLNQKSGVYFVQIISDSKTQTFKLIKQ